VDILKKISNIENLEVDPNLHGAGLHASPVGGKIDLHLDYIVNPNTKKERKLNLILFLNKNWKKEWGGGLELWDKTCSRCEKVIFPKFNTALIFKTGLASHHGVPKPIQSPEGTWRKTLTNYYVSDPQPDTPLRFKAEFFHHPDQVDDEKLRELRFIRKSRIITDVDLAKWPNWREEGNGWWV
jgi:hypothetical protein